MKRKLVALMLALLLAVLSMPLAMAEGEEITLVWYYSSAGVQKDTEKVNAAINELLKTYEGFENVSLVLYPTTTAEFEQQLILAQATQAQVDIVNLYKVSNFFDEVKKGNYIAMDEWMDPEAGLNDEVPEWIQNYGRYTDGKLYYLPSYQQATNQMMFVTPTAYLEKYGDAAKLDEVLENGTLQERTDAIYEYVKAVQAGEGKTKYAWPVAASMVSQSFGTDDMDDLMSYYRYFCETDELTYRFINEEAKQAYAITAKWFEDGLIHPDELTIKRAEFTAKNMMNPVSYVYTLTQAVGTEEMVSESLSKSYGFDVTAFKLDPGIRIPYNYAAYGNAITATCEHPETAMRFLELINTKKGAALYNMIVYGLEGVHYEMLDDTHIRTFDYSGTQGSTSASYCAHKWIIGNTFNAYLNQGCADGANEYILSSMNNPEVASISKLQGFVPDTSSVASEMAQISAINKEYEHILTYGVLGSDWEAYYEEYVQKMENAGLQKVLDLLHGQIDEFLAAKAQ